MALTERSRSALYQGLTDLIEDEVAVGELLSYFPARDVEEPATKEFVAAQIAAVRGEISGVRSDLSTIRAEMAAMETRLTTQMAAGQRATLYWTLGMFATFLSLVIAMGFLRTP